MPAEKKDNSGQEKDSDGEAQKQQMSPVSHTELDLLK
jgi:hypothetical protein